jgi:hypothetical protein
MRGRLLGATDFWSPDAVHTYLPVVTVEFAAVLSFERWPVIMKTPRITAAAIAPQMSHSI